MIEIQCTSCHTRYRIDERVLPDDTPTFKCSRCGHVFSAEAVPAKARRGEPQAAPSQSHPARTIRGPRPRAGALKSPLESDVVKREHSAELRQEHAPKPEAPGEQSEPEPERREAVAAEPPADQRSEREEKESQAADDPLNRRFDDREPKAGIGENLNFDFSEAGHEIGDPAAAEELGDAEPDDKQWQVGDTAEEPEARQVREAPSIMEEAEPFHRAPRASRRSASAIRAPAAKFARPIARGSGFQLGEIAEEEAAVGARRGAGFFIATFFFIGVIFLAAAAFISDEPAASARLLSEAPQIGPYFARPIVPAMIVALHDVQAEYHTLKGGHVALVISGDAQNVGGRAIHLVEIEAELVGDGGRALARQSVDCGNELSVTMLGEMTPHEIEFSQGLSPQKAFAIEPEASAPFLVVFINPPAGAGRVRLSVSKVLEATSGAALSPSSREPG